MCAGSGRLSWAAIVALVATFAWVGTARAVMPDTKPDAAADGPGTVVCLSPSRPGPTVPRESLLVRELVRQAVLIAARDGLGLSTRDGTLREPGSPTDANAPAEKDSTRVVLDVDVTRTENQVLHARLSEPSGASPRILWEKDFRLEKPDTYYLLPELLTVQAEAASRGELIDALKRADLKGKAAATDPAARVPEGVEAELSTLSIFPQFAALRQLHGAIRARGESQALLGALVRGYANMGLITAMQWNAAHQVFGARSLLYAQRMVATAPDKTSPLPLWHRAYAYGLAGLHAQAMRDLKAAEALRARQSSPEAPPPWVALIDASCQYNTSALLDAATSTPPSQVDISGLAAYLGFLSVLDDSNVTTTVRIARLAMAANPTCVQILDDVCRVGGVALNHEMTVSAPEVFTQAIEEELPQVTELPPEVMRAVQVVKSNHGDAVSRAALGRALVTAGQNDLAEPSWGMLGRLVQDTYFAQTQRRAYFMAFEWGVGDNDVSEYATAAGQLMGDHPYYPIIKAYGMVHLPGRALDELNRHLKLVDANLSMEPLQSEFGRDLKVGPDHASLWYRIVSHRDDTAWDLSREMALYSDPTDAGRLKSAILLNVVSPQSPTAMATMIRGAWDRVGDAKAQRWLKESGNHPMVMAALARHDLAAGHLDDAARLWEKVVSIAPDPQGYTSLAYVYLKQGNEDQWLATMKKVLSLEDNGLSHAQAENRIARHYMLQHRYTQAWPWAQDAAQSWAHWAMETAIDCAEGLEDWKDAETWAKNETERYAPSVKWYMWCRRTGHGNLAAARQAIQPSLALMKKRHGMEDLIVLGTYYLLEGQPDQALVYLRQRHERAASSLSALHVAVLLDERGDAAGRDTALNRALNGPTGKTPAEKQRIARLRKVIKLIRDGYGDGQFDLPALEQGIGDLPEQSRISDNYFVGRILIDKKQPAKGKPFLMRCISAPPFSYSLSRVMAYDLLRRQGVDPMAEQHTQATTAPAPATTGRNDERGALNAENPSAPTPEFGMSTTGYDLLTTNNRQPATNHSLMPLGRTLAEVFFLHRAAQVDVVDVRQRAQPRQHVGEFFLEIAAIIVSRQGPGQLADFLAEMQPGPRRAAGAVVFLIAVGDVLLKRAEGEIACHMQYGYACS